MHESKQKYILTLSCPDRMGIVADVSGFLVQQQCNITESAQFEDLVNKRFFMRTVFESMSDVTHGELRSAFVPIAEKLGMEWSLFNQGQSVRTLVMVSKLGHCLNALLFMQKVRTLPIDLRLIVSNHEDFAELAKQNHVPFHYLPVTPANKAEQERALIDLVELEQIELIVLARYMQILSDDFCARLPGRIINIHHSLLPSFKGAKPYHRAYERGVKLIGATAHYVTADLDEGPIIEQGVHHVRHNLSADELAVVGHQVESSVLARAVKYHAQHRVLLNGIRTVVFD